MGAWQTFGEEMSLGHGSVHILYNAAGVGNVINENKYFVMLRYIGGQGS